MTAEHGLPIVRACQIARLSRAAYYKPGVDRMARDAEVITALQAIVVDEQRWGFWKCHDRLRAQGYGWNHKRVWRVYCQLRLNLPRRTRRRVPHRERQPLFVERRMNAGARLHARHAVRRPGALNSQCDRRSPSRGPWASTSQ
jgi:putative transposase